MGTLIFVYNAFSGTHNAFLDSLFKLMNPNSLACNLCKITHGIFSEKPEWKKFRKESGIAMEFLHLDEFQKRYASKFGYKFTFPIVLVENGNEVEVFITTEELENIKDPQELIDLIKKRK